MEVTCNFCLLKATAEDCQNIKELVIDKSPGFIQFQAILNIVFGVSVDATHICQECFDSVLSHYTFREKVFKNLKLSNDGTNPIQNHVKKYLGKINEPVSVVMHQDILAIVPNSLKRRHNAQLQLQESFSPSIVVYDCSQDIEELKQKLKEETEAHQQSEVRAGEMEKGIFGDDDFYVSMQHLDYTQKPSTSTSRVDTRNKATKTLVNLSTSQFNNDEDLDTSGESSSEAQDMYSPVKRKGNARRGPPKRAKIVSEEIKTEKHFQDPLKIEEISIKVERGQSLLKPNDLLVERSLVDSPRLKRPYNTTDPELSKEQLDKLKELIKKSRRGVRGGVEKYQCHECSKILSSYPSIKYHIRSHHILNKLSRKMDLKVEQEKAGQSSFDFSLSQEQNDEMKELIKSSDQGDKFQCSSCHKTLKSIGALRYHVKHRHIMSQMTNEIMWISQQVRDGRREINDGGVVINEWHCPLCDNVSYQSHQSLRAHMKVHYGKLFKNEDSKEFIDMMVSTMGEEEK